MIWNEDEGCYIIMGRNKNDPTRTHSCWRGTFLLSCEFVFLCASTFVVVYIFLYNLFLHWYSEIVFIDQL
jgi:hypothetical protein